MVQNRDPVSTSGKITEIPYHETMFNFEDTANIDSDDSTALSIGSGGALSIDEGVNGDVEWTYSSVKKIGWSFEFERGIDIIFMPNTLGSSDISTIGTGGIFRKGDSDPEDFFHSYGLAIGPSEELRGVLVGGATAGGTLTTENYELTEGQSYRFRSVYDGETTISHSLFEEGNSGAVMTAEQDFSGTDDSLPDDADGALTLLAGNFKAPLGSIDIDINQLKVWQEQYSDIDISTTFPSVV